MHAAPAVRVSLGRSPGWIVFSSVSAGVAMCNAVAWLLLHAHTPQWAPPAVSLGVLASAVCARRMWRLGAEGALSWDGAQWWWRQDAGQVDAVLDLGHWMLLKFDAADGRRHWIAASRGATAGPWAALRAALYSPRAADPLATPPS